MNKFVVIFLSVLCLGCSGGDNDDTLLGIDADSDGVRDDVQAHIVGLDLDSRKTNALLNLARQYQTRFSLDMSDSTAVVAHLHELNQAVSCVMDVYEVNKLWAANKVIKEVGGMMSNTSQRREVRSQLRKATPAVLHDKTNEEDCP